MGSVLVSSELESIIDKDNILGRNTEDVRGLIQVTCSESDFSGTLEKIKKTNLKSVLEVSFLPMQMVTVSSLLTREERTFFVGSNHEFNANLSRQLSYSIVRKKDMYIWKIIIDNSE